MAKNKKPTPSKLIDKLDILVSDYVRASKNVTCERCNSQWDWYILKGKLKSDRGLYGIHCSHYMGRTNKATRFELDNLDCLCNGCHSYFEDRKQTAYRDWKIIKHGEERVIELEQLSRTTKKWQVYELEELIETYKQKLKELEG